MITLSFLQPGIKKEDFALFDLNALPCRERFIHPFQENPEIVCTGSDRKYLPERIVVVPAAFYLEDALLPA
jgi:hypothetical protein